jgi:hypothetical protein
MRNILEIYFVKVRGIYCMQEIQFVNFRIRRAMPQKY